MRIAKREGFLFLIFILFGILTTGFYDQAFDYDNFSEIDQISKDGNEDFDNSLCHIKELLGGIHSFQTLGLVTGFYLNEIPEKTPFESFSFLSFSAYRAPPVKF
jgi:hypothetical protein